VTEYADLMARATATDVELVAGLDDSPEYGSCVPGIDFLKAWRARAEAVRDFGFCCPTDEIIRAIKPYGPFVEVGAGTGYWAHCLGRAGVDVVATDPHVVPAGRYGFRRSWVTIEQVGAVQAVRRYRQRNMLIVWPCYQEAWAAKALAAFTGHTVVYAGEGPGGCTADDRFFELLDRQFDQARELVPPQWPGIHDTVQVWHRKPGAV
jgi:hypothetical protein